MTDNEVAFFNMLRRYHRAVKDRGFMADQVALIVGLSEDEGQRFLESWVDRGWWECGVSERTGWFTSAAPEKL